MLLFIGLGPWFMVKLVVDGLPAVGGVSDGGGGGGSLNPPGINTEFTLKWPVLRVLAKG